MRPSKKPKWVRQDAIVTVGPMPFPNIPTEDENRVLEGKNKNTKKKREGHNC